MIKLGHGAVGLLTFGHNFAQYLPPVHVGKKFIASGSINVEVTLMTIYVFVMFGFTNSLLLGTEAYANAKKIKSTETERVARPMNSQIMYGNTITMFRTLAEVLG